MGLSKVYFSRVADSPAELKMVSAPNARRPDIYMGFEVGFFKDGNISGR